MTPELQAFVSTYGNGLSLEAAHDFMSCFQRRLVRKGELLLRPGQVCQELFFVQSGCLRI